MDIENGHLILQQIAADDKKIDASVAGISTLDELEEKKRQWRKLWLEMLGSMPEKTPLMPQITGKLSGDGCTVEKVLFQSMPGVYVTGFLFLPDDPRFKAPYPALLLLLGHSENGKLRDNYFHFANMAAKEGFGVFAPDPVSQGERVQQEPQYQWRECAAEHTALGSRAWLLGWNFARFRLHDAVRSIDYMETRKELDLSKLAVAGCSGGGTMSTYLRAFDSRVKAAAPSCYVSSMREVIGERGLHDGEQFFYGQLARGINHAVLLAMGAPAAALMLDCRHSDYFPFAGSCSTAEIFRDLKKKLKIDTPFSMFSSDGGHGMPLCARKAILSWLKVIIKNEPGSYCKKQAQQILMDVEALRKIPDEKFQIPFDTAEANVTPTGQVRDLPGFKSLYTIIKEEALKLSEIRKPDREKYREMVRRRANIRTLENIPQEPPSPFVHDFKWWYLRGPEGYSVEQYAALLAVEGRSLIGERAEMFLRNAAAEHKLNGGKPVPLRAEGVWCIAAAHAYGAEPQLFSSVEFNDPPPSWTEMLTDPDPSHDSFSVTVWGALREYDWIDLVPDHVKI